MPMTAESADPGAAGAATAATDRPPVRPPPVESTPHPRAQRVPPGRGEERGSTAILGPAAPSRRYGPCCQSSPVTPRSRQGVVILASALASCTGVIHDPSYMQGDGPRGGPGEELTCETPEPGRSPLRRLTREELDETLLDLLGDATRPANRLLPVETVGGFSNNADVRTMSALVAEQLMALAEETAQRASADLPRLLGCDPDAEADGGDACFATFLARFGRRAYRRPLDADETARLAAVFSTSRERWGVRVGVELALEAMLMSPDFLYRVERPDPSAVAGDVVRLDPWQLASRLSYLFVGSTPDDELLDAAASGGLADAEGIETQARRLLDDPRAGDVMIRFFDEWLDLRQLEGLTKDPVLHPEYTEELAPLFREETHAFLREVLATEGGAFPLLLTADWSMMNRELAAYYGVEGPAGDAFERVELDGSRAAGILTQASFLATRAKSFETSPVHRGMFVRAGLLCGTVPPPPEGVRPIAPDPDPDLTMRERLRQHREDPNCNGCHRQMEPLGFAFEHFDAVGRWRDEENGLPVDATGEIVDSDVDGTFDGASALGERLASSRQVSDCMAQQWFRYGQGRRESADVDACSLAQLADAFAEGGQDLRELAVALTQTDAFLFRRVEAPGPELEEDAP